MRYRNIRLIFNREVRDQLRDRRTLFMIAVLPLLLYPLLGASLFQMAQFLREHATRVLVIGPPERSNLPRLIDGARFDESLFSEPKRARLLFVASTTADLESPAQTGLDAAQQQLRDGMYEAVVVFPPGFDPRLAALERSLAESQARAAEPAAPEEELPRVPAPTIYYNSAREKSQITYSRVSLVLERWLQLVGQRTLRAAGAPAIAARPFAIDEIDVAERRLRDAAVWAKLLPFMLLIWTLTGAFYPAVDLCAGEKERGTLETLLISPAERSDIVWGKLLAVMLFSMATALLNLLSMGLTFRFVALQLPMLGAPPPLAPLWLLVALVPIAALFSGLCLALAAFARSTKEGQYYLMPLVLVTLPLAMLPMAPGVELTLGNSLIPLSGVVLLLRVMLEGNSVAALPYLPPVVLVTLLCCVLAVRWAVDQFNREEVLFRESERLDVGAWVRHLLRDRDDTPTVAAAICCAVLILLVRFALNLGAAPPQSLRDLLVLGLVTQLVVIAMPALLMTIMFTRRPLQALALRWPGVAPLAAAVALAVAIHPCVRALARLIEHLYPLSEAVSENLARLIGPDPPLALLIGLLAAVPAVCEELAFRGFILTGLRRGGYTWRAIVITSFFFAATHPVLQQSLAAFPVGIVIGLVAVRSGSIFPAMAYHFVHNSLAFSLDALAERLGWMGPSGSPVPWLVRVSAEQRLEFSLPATIASGCAAALLVAWFARRPYRRTAEETLQAALDHERDLPAGG